MSLVLDRAVEGYGSNLALFSIPNVNTSIENIHTREFRPIGQISKGSTIEFDIQNNSGEYIWLKELKLVLGLNIHTDQGQAIKNANKVAFVNLPSSSIFRQVDLSLQNQIVTTGVSANYPYKAILDVLFNYNKDCQSTWLKTIGFEKDTAGAVDAFEPGSSVNTGLEERYKQTKSGNTIVYHSKLFLDILNQDRLLLNNVPLNLKLYPNNDKFCLQYKTATAAGSSKYYTVNIAHASLIAPFVRLNPGMLMLHAEHLKREAALYPYYRSEIRTFNISAGDGDWTADSIFQDNIPEQLIVCLVSSQSYNGHNQSNPFYFQHFNVNYIDFKINGCSNDANILQPNFKEKSYTRTYSKLFEGIDTNTATIPNITPDDFIKGYCFYKFELSRNNGNVYSNPIRKGQTSLSIKFSDKLTEATTVIAYGKFYSVLCIDEARNVSCKP